MEKKTVKEYVDKGFGFPVVVTNVVMHKIRGDWVPMINYKELTNAVLRLLAMSRGRLSGNQVRFVRHHFEMTAEAFAKRFGVTHPCVLKWEKTGNKPTDMGWTTEKDIRLFIADSLEYEAEKFKELYSELEDVAPRTTPKLELKAASVAAV